MSDSSRNLHVARAVLTQDCRRSLSLNNLTHITHLNSLTLCAIECNILQILDRLTELSVVTYQDVVLLAILTIVRGNSTIYSVTEICCSGSHIQATLRELLTVEYNLILRSILITREGNLRTSLQCEHSALNYVCDTIGLIEVVSVQLDIYGLLTTRTILLTRLDNLEGTNFRVSSKILTHQVTNLRQRTLTLGLLCKTDIH